MLSAGIFKTREQIFRVMLNADKNETMGLDFEEFLNALYVHYVDDRGGVRGGARFRWCIHTYTHMPILP